jgi:Uma2 family endonuclease
MNEMFVPAPRRPTTQAADGLPRWRWTVAEVEKLAAAGFFHEDERMELLGGEIVPMSPEGRRHETLRIELADRFHRQAPPELIVASDAQFNLSEETHTLPDILAHPRASKTYDLRGGDPLLLVEVAETSLDYDLRTKVPLYAAHGVRAYWVINAKALMTTVHRQPLGNSYAFTQELPADALLVPSLAPALAVSLSALDLD